MSKRIETAVFSTATEAADAVANLEMNGFNQKQISVLMSDQVGEDFKLQTKSKLPEGTAIGATTGGAIGAIAAGLTAVGAVVTGGGSLLVSGPLVAALAGAGAGAASGGLVGALAGFGITEHEAKVFADAYDDGKILVAVKCEDKDAQKKAEAVFEKCGAMEVASG